MAAQVGSLLLPGKAPWAAVATFALAAFGYAWLAFRLNAAPLFHAAAWSATGAVFLGLRAFQAPPAWYPAAAAGLALVYLIAATWTVRRWGETAETPLRKQALLALRVASGCLLAVAVLGGLASLPADAWAGIVALSLASVTVAAWSVLERRPWVIVAACGLFVAPVLSAAWVLMRDAGLATEALARVLWLAAVAAALALVYVLLGAASRRREAYASGLYLSGQALAPLSLLPWALIAHGAGIAPVQPGRGACG